MSKYPDVMKIQERERIEESLIKNYPIIKLADHIADLVDEFRNPNTTDLQKEIIANRLKALIYG